jgi:hypothetical protein
MNILRARMLGFLALTLFAVWMAAVIGEFLR